jgi:hypothetical protein
VDPSSSAFVGAVTWWQLGAVGPAATKSEGAAYTDGQGGNANGTTPRAEIMNTVRHNDRSGGLPIVGVGRLARSVSS